MLVGGGAVALAGPIASAVGIDNGHVAMLSAAFANAAGMFLMSNALDRQVPLAKTFRNNVQNKAAFCVVVAALVGGGVGFAHGIIQDYQGSAPALTAEPH